MELLRIDKSVEVFHTNASTSVAVTNGTSFSFVRTCSYLMLLYITSKFQIWFFTTWIDFSNYKPTLKVAEESEKLICEIYTKTKFHKICSTVTVNKRTIKDQNVTAVLEIFSFLAIVI